MPLTVNRLAKMLADAAEEHGVPNGISPGELCDGTRYRPMDVGHLIRSQRTALDRALAARGYTITSYEDAGKGYGMRIGIDVHFVLDEENEL